MNALYAMDELMGTNEININLPAITPAFLIASSVRYAFRKIYYALLKISKSKEETYASLRHIVLDIERLLVMRDDPPQSPPPLTAPEGYLPGVQTFFLRLQRTIVLHHAHQQRRRHHLGI